MTRENIHAIMLAVSDFIPQEQVLYLRNQLEKADDRCYDSFITIKLKSPVTTILFSVFLGCLGVDRFYIGDTGLGVAKLLLSWLTAGIWPLIDIFLCYKKVKQKNISKLTSLIY